MHFATILWAPGEQTALLEFNLVCKLISRTCLTLFVCVHRAYIRARARMPMYANVRVRVI